MTATVNQPAAAGVRTVAIIYNTTWYIYNFRRNLIKELQQKGYRVVAISPADAYVSRLRELGVDHYNFELDARGKNPLAEIRSVVQLYRLIREIKPQTVLSYTIKCNLYTGMVGRLLPFRQIANIPGLGEAFERKGWLNHLVRQLYKIAMGGAHTVFFQNAEDLDLFTLQGLVPSSRCQRIPGSGIDLTAFHPRAGSCPGDTRTFLMFGRILEPKGYSVFLEAARRGKAQFGDRVAYWVLGMEDPSRPDSIALARQLREADQEGVLKLIPQTDTVMPVIQAADVIVLPSWYNEGVPRSLLEALACGKPIITTDWRGCRETVLSGQNGMLVPVRDPEALHRAMASLVTMENATLARWGGASRQLAEQRFDERLVINSYLERVEAPVV